MARLFKVWLFKMNRQFLLAKPLPPLYGIQAFKLPAELCMIPPLDCSILTILLIMVIATQQRSLIRPQTQTALHSTKLLSPALHRELPITIAPYRTLRRTP